MSETEVKSICRICLSSSCNCSNIYVCQSSVETPIYESINFVYDLDISVDDGLPEHICQSCLGVVKEFEIYKRNAQRANKELMSLREKKDMIVKSVGEDYFGNDSVVMGNQIHEPQIEIHESLDYKTEKEEKNSVEDEQQCTTRIRRHRHAQADGAFKCTVCGKCFDLEERLNAHLVVHSGEKRFGCEQCGRKFYRKSSLSEHFMSHSERKPYECKSCSRQFIRRYDLEAHLMLHRGVKPFQCERCGRGFLKNNQLTRHVKIHTGVKPWECAQCGKGFVRKCDLKRHETIHGS